MGEFFQASGSLVDLIIGINCVVSYKWLNKISYQDLQRVSLENNRTIKNRSTDKWAINVKLIYL
jgi:hypothetical protein